MTKKSNLEEMETLIEHEKLEYTIIQKKAAIREKQMKKQKKELMQIIETL
jgi:hypothetical protein